VVCKPTSIADLQHLVGHIAEFRHNIRDEMPRRSCSKKSCEKGLLTAPGHSLFGIYWCNLDLEREAEWIIPLICWRSDSHYCTNHLLSGMILQVGTIQSWLQDCNLGFQTLSEWVVGTHCCCLWLSDRMTGFQNRSIYVLTWFGTRTRSWILFGKSNVWLCLRARVLRFFEGDFQCSNWVIHQEWGIWSSSDFC
jgi:hypothetical protein